MRTLQDNQSGRSTRQFRGAGGVRAGMIAIRIIPCVP